MEVTKVWCLVESLLSLTFVRFWDLCILATPRARKMNDCNDLTDLNFGCMD